MESETERGFKILCDTRDKFHAAEHILKYFDRRGIAWERVALKTGDYMIEGQPGLVIDRKKDLSELAHNLLSQDRVRFYNEIRRARAEGIKLIILCEQGRGVTNIEDVKKWVPKYGKASGRSLADAIFRLEIAYGVPVLYCDKRSTGKRIYEILTGVMEL